MTNLSNKGLDMMLELLTKVLPKGNLVSRSTYEAKKILRDLGMSYEHIDACKNDCALFWKENENLDKCPVCEAPRYKDTHAQGKMIPHKVLRYFPLTPRLRRLYMLGQRAKDMRWYIDKCMDDGIMRHPTDSKEWKEFDYTIHDYPGFGNVSGWRIKGYHSCYTCNDEPYSEALESKIEFINHRVYLPMEHRWRHSQLHNGLSEKRKRSLELQVGKIQEQLDRMPNIILGKHPSNKKRQLIGEPNWSKVSILYKLPYWKNKKLKYNIDVMHVEKNISESAYGTLLGIEGRNKDIDKARINLQNMNFRHTLHLKQYPDGSYDKPRASFSLSPNERDGFYDFLNQSSIRMAMQPTY
ncbi:uncharacterized protein LOC115961784 [Quercus lobata]|uniref:uncharacterized protein LOC115961784 n=1 Tax=Quercus lobata TaxID=97700 RepID=UPI001244A558|nr:uncharacterized protein LOC115961784 [Quercus lobata]